METAEDRKSGKFDFHSPGRDCVDKKHFRPFGFEVDPCTNEVCPRSEIDESVNSLDTVSSDEVEKASTLSSPEEIVCSKLKKKNSVSVMELRYECRFCLKKFSTSQTLGGHQNAHRKERLKKKRMEAVVRRGSFNLYLSSAMRNTGVTIYPHSFIGFDGFSCIPTVVLQNPLVSFSNIYPHHSSTHLPYLGASASHSEQEIGTFRGREPVASCPLLLKYHYPMLICKRSETPWVPQEYG